MTAYTEKEKKIKPNNKQNGYLENLLVFQNSLSPAY